MESLLFRLLPGRCPICSGGRSRHRNIATRCSSNQRQQLAAAAAVSCGPNQLFRALAGTAAVVALPPVCTFWVFFSRWQPPPNLASAASSSTLICVPGLGLSGGDSHRPFCERTALYDSLTGTLAAVAACVSSGRVRRKSQF